MPSRSESTPGQVAAARQMMPSLVVALGHPLQSSGTCEQTTECVYDCKYISFKLVSVHAYLLVYTCMTLFYVLHCVCPCVHVYQLACVQHSVIRSPQAHIITL